MDRLFAGVVGAALGNGDLEMDLESRKLYWKLEKNIQKQTIKIGRVTEVLMEKLLEISAGRYEFGWGASPNAVCCSSLSELCLVYPQGREILLF